jgi:hypothetical protein
MKREASWRSGSCLNLNLNWLCYVGRSESDLGGRGYLKVKWKWETPPERSRH